MKSQFLDDFLTKSNVDETPIWTTTSGRITNRIMEQTALNSVILKLREGGGVTPEFNIAVAGKLLI